MKQREIQPLREAAITRTIARWVPQTKQDVPLKQGGRRELQVTYF
jgi:hypothetical protein